jgi:dTDP-4-dehydrorhamnose reductase
MKVLISGASGFLGQALGQFLFNNSHEIYPVYYENKIDQPNATLCNFQDYYSTKKLIDRISPEIFIHCAALTNVDLCQREKLKCWSTNVEATMNICKSINPNIHFIHISTSQVFDGKIGNYDEKEVKNPINWYGTTKSISEEVVMSLASRWTIIRLSNLYGFDVKGKNFFHFAVTKLLENEKISAAGDTIISPTYIDTVVSAVNEIILEHIHGIYNIADLETSTKYEILLRLSQILDKEGLVSKEEASKIFTAPRPRNTSINIGKFSKNLRSTKPLKLNEGLSKFVNKFS